MWLQEYAYGVRKELSNVNGGYKNYSSYGLRLDNGLDFYSSRENVLMEEISLQS